MFKLSLNKALRHARTRQANRMRRFSALRSRGPEQLEPRQMLSVVPPTFYIVDDATTNVSYHYASDEASLGFVVADRLRTRRPARCLLSSEPFRQHLGDRRQPQGVRLHAVGGSSSGSWTAGSLANNATPEGIATNGTDICGSSTPRATRSIATPGPPAACPAARTRPAASALNSGNTNPKDIVTDGTHLWVVNDSSDRQGLQVHALRFARRKLDDRSGQGADGHHHRPRQRRATSGLSDSGTDRVYQYTAATSRTSGSQAAASSFHVANGNSQGMAVAVSWVRQLGGSGADTGAGVSADGQGNVYMSGNTDGSLGGPNAGGADSFLTKYDAAGNLQWTRQLGSAAYDVSDGPVTDGLGNVYISGITAGSLGGRTRASTMRSSRSTMRLAIFSGRGNLARRAMKRASAARPTRKATSTSRA